MADYAVMVEFASDVVDDERHSELVRVKVSVS